LSSRPRSEYILNGVSVHGPPYTDEENRDMFRRMQNGPRMMTSVVRGRQTSDPAAGAVKGGGASTTPDNSATSKPAADAAADPASPEDLPPEIQMNE
jgi:hypothetical protein